MTEAEVSLRLALYLVQADLVISDVQVAIDGPQVKTDTRIHFDVPAFLRRHSHLGESGARWQCRYVCAGVTNGILVHSNPGRGDIVASLRDGRTLRVESKKGPLERKLGSPEYRLMREAIGQLMTVAEAWPTDYLAIAVPNSPKFEELASRWRTAPLIRRVGIGVILVSQDGRVGGFEGLEVPDSRIDSA
jgi:hypothetical protein